MSQRRNRYINPCSQHGKAVFHAITPRQEIINIRIRTNLKAFWQDGQQVEDIVLQPQAFALADSIRE